MRSALTSKVQNNKLIVVDEIRMDEIKTQAFRKMLENLNAEKALVVMDSIDEKVVLSARNLPRVQTSHVIVEKSQGEDGQSENIIKSTINVYDIMKYESVVVTKNAVANIEEVYA